MLNRTRRVDEGERDRNLGTQAPAPSPGGPSGLRLHTTDHQRAYQSM